MTSKISNKINSGEDKPKIVDWQITNNCNYNCSYCPIGKKNTSNLKNPQKFLKRIKTALPGSWEFIISGGEPFIQPNFLKIVKELIKMDHTITVVTNFSAPLSQIKEFCKITEGGLKSFTASLHLEHVDSDSFLKKAVEVNKLIISPALFSTVSVAKGDNLKNLERIGKKFIKNGIKFRLQPFKSDRHFIGYSSEGKRVVEQFGGQRFGLEDNNFKGKKCWTGCRYFVLSPEGNAFRCYSAKYRGKEYLGNILEGTLKLYRSARPCLYEACLCPNPFYRGLIETF